MTPSFRYRLSDHEKDALLCEQAALIARQAAWIAELEALLRGDNRLIFVSAWNEWAEGACLEPDRTYGHRWPEALRTVMLKTGYVWGARWLPVA